MSVYDPKSLHAEDFINDAEIRETLAYAEAHKNDLALQMIVMSKYELDDGEFDEMRDILYREVYHYSGRKTK